MLFHIEVDIIRHLDLEIEKLEKMLDFFLLEPTVFDYIQRLIVEIRLFDMIQSCLAEIIKYHTLISQH